MSTTYICDGCGKQTDFLEASRISGSKKLRDALFCSDCFKHIEKYIVYKFKLAKISKDLSHEQIRSQTN